MFEFFTDAVLPTGSDRANWKRTIVLLHYSVQYKCTCPSLPTTLPTALQTRPEVRVLGSTVQAQSGVAGQQRLANRLRGHRHLGRHLICMAQGGLTAKFGPDVQSARSVRSRCVLSAPMCERNARNTPSCPSTIFICRVFCVELLLYVDDPHDYVAQVNLDTQSTDIASKCDEAKPSCWQCTRHNVPCDFSNSRPSSISGASPSASENGVHASVSPMGVSPAGLRADGTLPVNTDVAVEDATTGTVLSNSNDGDAQDEDPETSASAAFAFLEWGFNFNFSKDDLAVGHHLPPTQMPYDAARDTHFAAPSFAPRTSVSCPSAIDTAALNMTDLFLLHHYTTVTARSLCPWHAEVQKWWTHEVPRVAVRHPFVMRSLLTVAGLHVAYLCESGDSGEFLPQPGDGTETRSFHIARAIEQHKLAGQTAASMLPMLDRATSAPMYVLFFFFFPSFLLPAICFLHLLTRLSRKKESGCNL